MHERKKYFLSGKILSNASEKACFPATSCYFTVSESLKTAGHGEESCLEPLIELLNKGLTPADIIISNWQNCSNNNLFELINYSKIA